MAAIKCVAGPIASVPLYFTLRNQDTALRDDKLERFWAEPAVGLLFADFVEAYVGWMKLRGECFAVFDDRSLVPFPEAQLAWPQFIVARPDRMKEVKADGTLAGWVYTDGNRQTHELLPEQVYQWKFWNPSNDFRGLSEYEAATLAAETDRLNQKFSKNLAASNGDTGPIISPDGTGLTDQQVKQIVSQLEAKRRALLRGDFMPAFLNGKIKVEDSQIRSPDASFQAQRVSDREAIYVALGVPASMTTAVAAYSVGSASDRYRLIEDSCKPLSQKLLSGISRIASKMTGKEVVALLDWTQHSISKEIMREQMANATALWDRGMPWQQINEYLTMGMQPFKGWETGYVSFGLAPVGSEGLPDNSADYSEPDGEGDASGTDLQSDGEDDVEQAVQEARRAIRQRQVKRLLDARKADEIHPDEVAIKFVHCCGCSDELPKLPADLTPVQRAEEERRRSLWRQHMARRRKVMKSYETKFSRLVFDLRSKTLAKVEASPELRAGENRAAVADFLFSWDSFLSTFLAEMRKVAINALQVAGNQLFEEIGKDDPWSMPPARALTFLQERDNKMTGVAQDVFDRIRNAIEYGLEAGDSRADLADRIRGTANEISEGRATLVAQTETAHAYGVARHEAMVAAGILFKGWLSSRNKSVRPTHVAADETYMSEPIPADEPFIVGGYPLQHPGDPSGPAGEVINCHCVEIAMEAPNE